jgi:hypothetical protein
MAKVVPIVGNWYQELEEDLAFEVVALDEEGGTVEVQYVDGEIGEFDMESWDQLLLISIDEPEDWRNGYELSSEDSADNEAILQPGRGYDPLGSIEPTITNGLLDD